jgi:AraC-like DNA-binding protein|tara:strand:+ start:8273 stop:9277 length:1005 start_codon:yes stop_codon:yes gene_type:complete
MAFNGRFLHNIIEQASSRGASKATLLNISGKPESELMENDCKVDYQSFNKTFETALREVKDPLLGIHITQSMSLSAAGLMVQIAQSSKTFKDAILLACNYAMLGCDSLPMRLEETEYSYELIFNCDRIWRSNSEETFQHTLEGSLFFLLKEYEALTGKKFSPVKITLDYTPRVSFKELEKYYRAPVFIRDIRNTVVFRKKDLDTPITSADHELLQHLILFAEDKISRLDQRDTIVEQVGRIIMKNLPDRASADLVARELNMSVRTMQRQLKYEDTSFRGILENNLMDFARKQIIRRKHTLSQIAYQLNYSDLSAFSRAYKNHFGEAPTKIRRDV